jgi:hypothetical protein
LTEPDLETVICRGAKDDSVQDEEWRQQLLREQERDRRQAILDWHVEQIRAAEAAERAYWREMREALDPFNYGHLALKRMGVDLHLLMVDWKQTTNKPRRPFVDLII